MSLSLEITIQAAIFDFDGTLIDSSSGIQKALSSAFESIGRTMPDADIRKVIGPPIGVIAKNLDASLTQDEISSIERAYRSGYDSRYWLDTALYPGVRETLNGLRGNGIRLFLATNKPAIPTAKIISHLGLTGLFESIVSRDSRIPAYSSKSELLGSLIENCGLKKGHTLLVGDTQEDESASRSNNLRFVFANYGYGSVPSAELKIDRLDQLTSLILQNHEI
jgi:phosphoglycolate phosphatase